MSRIDWATVPCVCDTICAEPHTVAECPSLRTSKEPIVDRFALGHDFILRTAPRINLPAELLYTEPLA